MSALRRSDGSALVVAILLVALAGVLATSLAELGRLAIERARQGRDGVRAWLVAEAGLAETVAGAPSAHAFTADLRAHPAPPAAAGAAWTYAIGFQDDADDAPDDRTTDRNARVTLRVHAFGPPPVRRRLEAVLARNVDPDAPAALTLDGDARTLTAEFLLDGRDFDMSSRCTVLGAEAPRAGLVLPEGAALPMLADPAGIQGVGDAPSIARQPSPDMTEMTTTAAGTHVPAGPLPAVLGTDAAPRFIVVDGDALADATTAGAGALHVRGRLRVTGRLELTGMLTANGGIELAPGAVLEICGGAWAGGAPALDARGAGFVRASAAALRLAATLAPLPAPARVVAIRETY
jgi:hypothetical protein